MTFSLEVAVNILKPLSLKAENFTFLVFALAFLVALPRRSQGSCFLPFFGRIV